MSILDKLNTLKCHWIYNCNNLDYSYVFSPARLLAKCRYYIFLRDQFFGFRPRTEAMESMQSSNWTSDLFSTYSYIYLMLIRRAGTQS